MFLKFLKYNKRGNMIKTKVARLPQQAVKTMRNSHFAHLTSVTIVFGDKVAKRVTKAQRVHAEGAELCNLVFCWW